MDVKKIEGEDQFEVVIYKKAVAKDGTEVEVVDRTERVTMQQIDSNIKQATEQKTYWENIKAQAEKL